jgi:hypothetical protein
MHLKNGAVNGGQITANPAAYWLTLHLRDPGCARNNRVRPEWRSPRSSTSSPGSIPG